MTCVSVSVSVCSYFALTAIVDRYNYILYVKVFVAGQEKDW